MNPPQRASDARAEKQRKRDEAQNLLRRTGGDPQRLLDLAKELKGLNEFGYARRLLARAREFRVPELELELGQEHSLCTYKDPDLPTHEKLARALEILTEVEDLETTTDQESLGRAGAIYKRMWEADTDKEHLEWSLHYYQRGYDEFKQDPSGDYGYTAINAAYVLDLLADLEDEHPTTPGLPVAESRRAQAREIRQRLVDDLPPLQERSPQLLRKWWYVVTVAEAFFGLRDYVNAQTWLDRAKGLEGTPLWELESTATQLASLARLQSEASDSGDGLEHSEAWELIQEFLDGRADAVRTIFAGKFGLALSGGGFRASFFHIGVLAKLAELDLLRHVHVLSCVSGGSIVGAQYYLELRHLLQTKADVGDEADDGVIDRGHYLEIVWNLQERFLQGVRRNLRTRVASNLFVNLKMAFSSTYSRTDRLGELFERELYGLVEDGGKGARVMQDLLISPKGETGFNPKERNWLRRNKIPMLVLNATTLNTGHNWQFTATWMGEPPFTVDPEVDGNWRYRRMYYSEAPERYREVRLGRAVGASACVPGLFEPVAMPDLYPKKESEYPEMTVRLVDGGVHDNQGVATLLEQDCTVLFVSDASGQMTSQADPAGGVLAPLLRSNTSLMERVRQAQFADLKARHRASLLKDLVIVHLKKGLSVDPVSWRRCKEPADTPLVRKEDLLEYGVHRRIQASIAGIRTDLDSFTEVEAYALMASGYLMTETYAKGITGYPQHQGERHGWPFLQLEPALAANAATEEQQDDVEKQLRVGAEKAFKVWRLHRWLTAAGVILVLAAIAGFVWAWRVYPDFTLIHLNLGWLGWTAFWAALTLLVGKGVVSVLRYQNTLRRILKYLGFAVGGFVAAQLHLLIFDRLFWRRGKIERVL